MDKKTIHIDKNYLAFNKSNRRQKKIKKTKSNKSTKNTKDLCKHFLENIKNKQGTSYNKSAINSSTENNKSNISSSFNKSLDFFNSITKLNKTKKHTKHIPNSNSSSNSKINISFPNTNLVSTSNNLTSSLPPFKLKAPPPYGCLKNSNIPTYRQWVKTQKNKPSISLNTKSTTNNSVIANLATTSDKHPILSNIKPMQSNSKPMQSNSKPTYLSSTPCNITTPPELNSVFKPKTASGDIISIPLNHNKATSNKTIYSKGECVLYKNTKNIFEKATIIDIHMDSLKPYYTIKLHNSDIERQTEPGRLCYENNLDLANENKIFIKKNVRTVRHKLGKRQNKIGILIKDKKRRETIRNMKGKMGKEALRSVKKYLRDKNLIKIGSKAPNDVIRTIYQDSKLAGDINNTGKGILMHNYLNNENNEISLES